MNRKKVVILGSTGSIGRSALDVIGQNGDRLEVLALTAHSSVELLRRQIDIFRPEYVVVTDPRAASELKAKLDPEKTRLLDSDTGLDQLVALEEADIILNAIVGAAGLKASLGALVAGKRLALANKESLVIGGELLREVRARSGAEIIPVDSEHSAIWQALFSGRMTEVKRIILTASGGPFRDLPPAEFENITRDDALRHPTWNMGPKITVDSATMMNKGLEIIEAMHLFAVPVDMIDVVIHPQSIIHSLVEFVDSSIVAQLSEPDMRLPIRYALFYPERIPGANGRLDLFDIDQLTFAKPDYGKFPLIELAYDVARIGGTAPTALNAANEIAVEAFLDNRLRFSQIPEVITRVVEQHRSVTGPSLDDILAADREARYKAKDLVG